VGLLAAGVAWASPWDIDMIDSRAFKAYEWKMLPQPEGSVQRDPVGPRPAGAYQVAYVAPVDRMNAAQVDPMVNPYGSDAAVVAQGKRLFEITCQPCHGVEGKGGGTVTYNDPANNIRRFQLPAPLLSGTGAVTAIRSDGYIYGTIRNGGALMPSYGIALTDAERWSVVSYIRTLDGATYTPPAPPAETTPATGGTK
jgi:mono/diheme cytochrome c family protein